MRRAFISSILLCFCICLTAQTPLGKGQLTVKKVAHNAVRVQFTTADAKASDLPDWLYVKHGEVVSDDIAFKVDAKKQTLTISDQQGKAVFKATRHQLENGVATLAFESPEDEFLFGLGQFQDGYSNVRGLSRRLTQVNTQHLVGRLPGRGGERFVISK